MNQLTRFSAVIVLGSISVQAAPLLFPTDAVFGGRSDGTSFLVGAVGTDGGNTVYTDNVWPMNESPDHLVDGVSQKFLSFAELNTGFIVTPGTLGVGNTSIATSLQIWTANDADVRDPASYELYGTNATITGSGPFALTLFTLISSGPLSLPLTRNGTGTAALVDANSQTVAFANSQSYKSYLVLFPTVRNEPSANSMQVGEVEISGTIVPEPGVFALAGVASIGLLSRRRRVRA